MEWKLADAKNRFSELVNRVLLVGPQRIRRRNDTVVVISAEEYDRLTGEKISFSQYLMQGESLDGVEVSRDRSSARDVGL